MIIKRNLQWISSVCLMFTLLSISACASSTAGNQQRPQQQHVKTSQSSKTTNTAATTDQSSSTAASANTNGEPKPQVFNDRFEKYNRFMFKFNNEFDKLVAKPIATFYTKVMPRPLQHGAANMFDNVDMTVVIFNDLLQAKFAQAASDTWRFGINSTIGLGGFFDPATHLDLPQHTENFNLTLAYWGWKNSSYFILPFLGPSTIRGTVAVPVNWLTSVYSYLPFNYLYTYGIVAFRLVIVRAQLLEYQQFLNQLMLDPYVFYRNAYLQRQAYLIGQNERRQTISDNNKAVSTGLGSVIIR
ncbi:MAG: VacJ family lipoprotein [Pseudomonadota bacterium]